jgi:hypothetical protein
MCLHCLFPVVVTSEVWGKLLLPCYKDDGSKLAANVPARFIQDSLERLLYEHRKLNIETQKFRISVKYFYSS